MAYVIGAKKKIEHHNEFNDTECRQPSITAVSQ